MANSVSPYAATSSGTSTDSFNYNIDGDDSNSCHRVLTNHHCHGHDEQMSTRLRLEWTGDRNQSGVRPDFTARVDTSIRWSDVYPIQCQRLPENSPCAPAVWES